MAIPHPRWSGRVLGVSAAAALMIAVGAALIIRESRADHDRALVGGPAELHVSGAAPVISAAASTDAMESAPIPTQFVYDGPGHHVTLVGDFNGWDENATPLERERGSALWSVTVPLQRGRHVYAFIVDSAWTTDRRAPLSRDPDFGVEGSVIIVGRP